MTEEDAKTKWCPMVRTGVVAGMAVNRHVADVPKAMDGVYDETRCIASDCMMWRWDGLSPETVVRLGSKPEKKIGYCGLAGTFSA